MTVKWRKKAGVTPRGAKYVEYRKGSEAFICQTVAGGVWPTYLFHIKGGEARTVATAKTMAKCLVKLKQKMK